MQADFRRLFKYSSAPKAVDIVRCIFRHYGFMALLVYRFGQWLRCGQCRLALWPFSTLGLGLYYLLEALIRLLFDIHLNISAKIGPGFYIGHFGGINVHKCVIGEHCSIQQQVRLGPLPGETQGPIIGNRVWIGAHTQIHGSWHIGDGATIGAGSVVHQNVPPRCLALGSPLRILRREFDNSMIL